MRKMRVPLLLLLALVFPSSLMALTFNVEASKEECLFEEVNSGVRVSGSFQVSWGYSVSAFLKLSVCVGAPSVHRDKPKVTRHQGFCFRSEVLHVLFFPL